MFRCESSDFTDLRKMPPPEPRQNIPSTSIGFGRQDSLAVAASLQEQDRAKSMVDFMETELDLENYLACFNELDVPIDEVDLNDGELTKARLLYDDTQFCQENNPFMNHSQYDTVPQHTYQPYNRTTELYHPDVELPLQNGNFDDKLESEVKKENVVVLPPAKKSTRPIKKPQHFDYDMKGSEDWDDSASNSSSDSSDGSTSTPPKKSLAKRGTVYGYTPQTKARKYKLKAETEKAEPTYKIKRARNNDAVRKSRSKAKEIQKKKDEEYDKMRARIAELEGLLEAEKNARQRDRETIQRLLEKN